MAGVCKTDKGCVDVTLKHTGNRNGHTLARGGGRGLGIGEGAVIAKEYRLLFHRCPDKLGRSLFKLLADRGDYCLCLCGRVALVKNVYYIVDREPGVVCVTNGKVVFLGGNCVNCRARRRLGVL